MRLFAVLLKLFVALQSLCFLGNGVIVFGDETVDVADGFVENVQALVAFYSPEDVSMLEPGVGEHAVDAPENVGEVSYALLSSARGVAT